MSEHPVDLVTPETPNGAPRSAPSGDPQKRLPDFLIIGAAKSGTTTLYEYLDRHPRIFASTQKEPQYFSDDDVYARGLEWYHQLFAGAREDQLCGEFSTTYTRWPHTADAAARIAELLPEARFIYLMRNPVDRAYSHYGHHMRESALIPFEDALKADDIYVDCGMYLKQIERYLQYYPRENFLFQLFEDFMRDRNQALAEIQQFLGVEEIDARRLESIHANPGSDTIVRFRVAERLRRVPGVPWLIDAMPKSWRDKGFSWLMRTPLRQPLEEKYKLPKMRPETRERLKQLFEQPNRDLAEFLGRDLSLWS